MLHQCDRCPGKEALKEHLDNILDQSDTDDKIEYRQRSHGGQCKLQTLVNTAEEFLELLLDKSYAATVHHYTAKAQAESLRLLKESLDPESAVILLNFAENYSFVCQDAVQSFRWDTQQASLHPFVVYH